MPRNVSLLCFALALLAVGAARCARLQRDREEDLMPADAAQKQKLRHGRFEKLDGLFQKLSELNAGAERPAPTTARPPEPEESEEGHDEDYDEEEPEDYEDPEERPALEGLSEEQQFDAFFDDLLQPSDRWDDSDVVADDPDDDWQDFNGEYQNSQPESSTRKRQESSNVRFNRNSHQSLAALAHFRQMSTVGKCSVPQPRVVSVQALHPHASKIYLPLCTILHRCSDDTGCCLDDYKTCVPKKTKQIDLPFFVKSLDGAFSAVENLEFENHTECGCVSRRIDTTVKDERNHLPHYQPTGVYHSSETETESPLTLRRRGISIM